MNKSQTFRYDVFTLEQYLKKEPFLKQIAQIFKHATYDPKNPDYVFCFGGDGTFIRAIKYYYLLDTKLIFINHGNLGFLANFETLDELINAKWDEQDFEPFEYLEIVSNLNHSYLAINEFSLFDHFTNTFKLRIDGTEFYDHKSSGFSISTALGSTGLNRSNYGPLLMQDLGLIYSEISPLNYKNARAMCQDIVFNKNTVFDIDFTNFQNKIQLVCDNDVFLISPANNIKVQLKKAVVKGYHIMDLKTRIKKIKALLL